MGAQEPDFTWRHVASQGQAKPYSLLSHPWVRGFWVCGVSVAFSPHKPPCRGGRFGVVCSAALHLPKGKRGSTASVQSRSPPGQEDGLSSQETDETEDHRSAPPSVLKTPLSFLNPTPFPTRRAGSHVSPMRAFLAPSRVNHRVHLSSRCECVFRPRPQAGGTACPPATKARTWRGHRQPGERSRQRGSGLPCSSAPGFWGRGEAARLPPGSWKAGTVSSLTPQGAAFRPLSRPRSCGGRGSAFPRTQGLRRDFWKQREWDVASPLFHRG